MTQFNGADAGAVSQIKDQSRASLVLFTSSANHDDFHQLPRENSNSAHEHQDQQNYDDEAQAAAAVIAGTVEWRAAEAADATEKDQNQNDENDCPNRHEFAPSILPILRGAPMRFRNAILSGMRTSIDRQLMAIPRGISSMRCVNPPG